MCVSAAAAFSDYCSVKFATSAHQTTPEVLAAPQKARAQLHPSPLTTSRPASPSSSSLGYPWDRHCLLVRGARFMSLCSCSALCWTPSTLQDLDSSISLKSLRRCQGSLLTPLSVALACFIFLHNRNPKLLSADCLLPPVIYTIYIWAEGHCLVVAHPQ